MDNIELLKRFDEIIQNETRDGFHDSSFRELKINLMKKEITVEIEHHKDSGKEREDKVVLAHILFKGFSYINLDNAVECFGIEDEISSFDADNKNGKVFFNIIGIKGWVLSLIANSIEYSETFIEYVKY